MTELTRSDTVVTSLGMLRAGWTLTGFISLFPAR